MDSEVVHLFCNILFVNLTLSLYFLANFYFEAGTPSCLTVHLEETHRGVGQ